MKWSLSVASMVVMFVAGSLPAGAEVFTGVFSGDAEEMPNESEGTGDAEVELDPVEHVLRVDVSFSGLMSPTTVAHIHCCAPPGESAGVATTPPTFPGFPANVTNGSYQMTFDTTLESTFNPMFIANNGGTPAAAEAALLEGLNSGMAYFNIHTMTFGAGEIRADLVFVEPGTPTATPTATVTLPAGTASATITLTPAATPTVTGQATETATAMVTESPTGPSPTPTATPPGGSPTMTSGTPMTTATATPNGGATGSPVRTATSAPGGNDGDDDSCAIVAPQRSGGGALFLLVPAALLVVARRRRS